MIWPFCQIGMLLELVVMMPWKGQWSITRFLALSQAPAAEEPMAVAV